MLQSRGKAGRVSLASCRSPGLRGSMGGKGESENWKLSPQSLADVGRGHEQGPGEGTTGSCS